MGMKNGPSSDQSEYIELEPVLELSSSERSTATIAHLVTFAGYLVPFSNVLGPLLVYLVQRRKSAYVAEHAVEALNFQISWTVYLVCSLLLTALLVGYVFIFLLCLLDLIVTLKAALRASRGEAYRYPLTFRFVRNGAAAEGHG